MTDTAPSLTSTGQGRIDTGPVLAGTVRALRGHLGLIPRLAWPAVLVALLVPMVQRFGFPNVEAAASLNLLTLPFDVMLATAWLRLLLLGRPHARVPALGWGKAETDFLIWAFVFAVSVLGAIVLITLVISNLPIGEQAGRIAIAATAWVTLSLMTPLAVRVPVRTIRAELPGRAWQARLANVPNAALAWLVYLVFAVAATQGPAHLPQPQDPSVALPLAAGALLVEVLVEYLLLLTVLTLIAVMARQLSGWPDPGARTESAETSG
ncbi:hypothetical protein CKO28_01760 [Rhodovibrio sodomensis]|uniref:DUF4328 domain-containing protein n=1 Tax=Rhodovibrio sodomensis TaxID=1088 RepID=A0ABS1D9S0_9PROT|nr:hypothetical protein [Rhodovibrio sodomensis]MBK1666769.1 hypothetical protein [Rhodovibrio sodomensis]